MFATGDAFQIFAGSVPTDERRAEDELLRFCGEVATSEDLNPPIGAGQRFDLRATAATASRAAAADGGRGRRRNGDDW